MYYFYLHNEPNTYIWVCASLLSLITGLLFRKRIFILSVCLCSLVFSIAVVNASIRTKALLSSKLDVPIKSAGIRGVIEKIYPLESGKRIILKVNLIKVKTAQRFNKPKTIQLSIRTNSKELEVGKSIFVYADIHPPSARLFPNKYDFSRHLFYRGVDANGFAVSKVKILNFSEQDSFWNYLAKFRNEIYEMLISKMGVKHGKVASALMIGEQRSVHAEILSDMRKSGLSHILSVSGMHLSLVSIICFFLVRMILSNFVSLSQKYNTKKIAAVVSMIGVTFYLFVSGMQIATLRAFVMVSFIILGVFIDREDDSKRSLCFAALLILIFMPESIFHPGFQMSFAAVLGLVASYEIYIKYFNKRGNISERGIFGRIKLYFLGVVFSSFVAGLSTSMFIVYHFNNYAHYSVFANLIMAPVVSFLLMPGVVLTFLLMPFGIVSPGLFILELGIKFMLMVANYFAHLPGSVSFLPTIPTYILLLFVLGFIWLSLWERRWRLLGIIPIILSLSMMTTLRFPSLIIDSKYKGILMKRGKVLHKIGGQNRCSNWYKEQWMNLTDTKAIKKIYVKSDKYHFSAEGCNIYIVFNKPKRNLYRLESITIDNGKQKVTISDKDLAANGSYFVYLDPKNIKYEYAADHSSARPWS